MSLDHSKSHPTWSKRYSESLNKRILQDRSFLKVLTESVNIKSIFQIKNTFSIILDTNDETVEETGL